MRELRELFELICEYPFVTMFLALMLLLVLNWIESMTELFLYRNKNIEDEKDDDASDEKVYKGYQPTDKLDTTNPPKL